MLFLSFVIYSIERVCLLLSVCVRLWSFVLFGFCLFCCLCSRSVVVCLLFVIVVCCVDFVLCSVQQTTAKGICPNQQQRRRNSTASSCWCVCECFFVCVSCCVCVFTVFSGTAEQIAEVWPAFQQLAQSWRDCFTQVGDYCLVSADKP